MIIPHRQSFNIFYNCSSHSQSMWTGITQGDGNCSVPLFSQSSCLQSPPHQKAHSPSKEQRVQTSNQASTWGCTGGVDCLWGCLSTCPGFDSLLSVTCLQLARSTRELNPRPRRQKRDKGVNSSSQGALTFCMQFNLHLKTWTFLRMVSGIYLNWFWIQVGWTEMVK